MQTYLKSCSLFLLFFLFIASSNAQETIDGSFEFQTDPAKKYSLYIPSTYDASVPQPLMLALHPFNVNRWDGEAWRDTLIVFAENNNLLLVSPDGGADGQIDNPIDTAFTSTLLDSVATWYNINQQEKYIMGFSWGGKTAYTYGLRRTDEFAGYLIIGAAITIGEVNGTIENASEEKFYLVHGELDNPNVRFYPFLNALEENNACFQSTILPNVGHTIDFLERNQILSDAFNWIKVFNCTSSTAEESIIPNVKTWPNPSGHIFFIDQDVENLRIHNIQGQSINFIHSSGTVELLDHSEGVAFLSFTLNGQKLNRLQLIVN